MTSDFVPGLTITRVSTGSAVPVLRVVGEIDANTVVQLRQELAAIKRGWSTSFVIDLSEVTFLGVDGTRALLTAAQHSRAQGSWLSLVVCTRAVRRVFAACGIDEQVQTHATLDEALVAATPAPAAFAGRQ